MNQFERGGEEKRLTRQELGSIKDRWLPLNADYDAKFAELLGNPDKIVSPEELARLRAEQRELAELENRVLRMYDEQ
jgi:hypothetical protein